MIHLRSWFERDTEFKKFIQVLPELVLLMGVTTFFGGLLANMFFSNDSLYASDRAVFADLQKMGIIKVGLIVSVIGPIIEEATFRFLPLGFTFLTLWLINKKQEIGLWSVLGTILASSILFGYIHGPGNILIQGISGLVLAVVFVKYSSFGRSPVWFFKGWAASTLLHGSFNGVILVAATMHR